MKFVRKHLGYTIAIALLLAGAGIALAQNAGQFMASPTGAEAVQIYPSNTGATVYATVSQLRDSSGYQLASPTTGATVQVSNNVSVLQLTPAGTLATLTVTFPTVPIDGQRVEIFSTQILTALTLAGSGGATVNQTVTTFAAANTSVEYLYRAANTSWNRIQ